VAPLRVVINADDLGIDSRRDDGIFAAYGLGAITQSTLMVSGPSAVQAAARARRVRLPLGLHLDLTEFAPAAPPVTVPTLLTDAGAKRGKRGFRVALADGEVEVDHVLREAHAQLEAFADLVGERASHVDGHQHVHVAELLIEPLARLFAGWGVRSTRIPIQRDVPSSAPMDRLSRAIGRLTSTARPVFARHGVRSTHSFIGLECRADAAARLAEAVSASLCDGSLEVMCHVGYSGTLGDDFNRSTDRERELEVMSTRPLAEFVRRNLVELVSFHELADRRQLC
jgi:chitin disaccharide deacetylase